MCNDPRVPEDWDYTLQFPRDPLAPRIARRILRLILEEHGVHDLADTAELLASELVTNTYVHSDGQASMNVRRSDKRVRVSVCDTNPQLPALTTDWAGDVDAEQGRGIGLLDVVADSWDGCAIGDELFGVGGKTVWFELGEGWRDA